MGVRCLAVVVDVFLCLLASAVLDAADVARYHFDEGAGQTVADSSGNANHGTLGDDSSVETDDPAWGTSAQAKWGSSCIVCTRSQGDWVRVPDSDSLDVVGLGTVHLEAWIYPFYVRSGAASYPNQYLIYKGNTDGTARNYWLNMFTQHITFPPADYTGLEFGLVAFGGTTYTARYPNCIPAANSWYFVSATYDAAAGTCRFYVNAASYTDSTIGSRIMVANTSPLTVGRGLGPFADTYAFGGRIDEVVLARENRPTAVEVSELRAAREAGAVVISWQTPSALGLLGFHVLRSDPRGHWTRVNENVVPARCSGGEPVQYRFSDRMPGAEPTVYRLQAIGPDGRVRWVPGRVRSPPE